MNMNWFESVSIFLFGIVAGVGVERLFHPGLAIYAVAAVAFAALMLSQRRKRSPV